MLKGHYINGSLLTVLAWSLSILLYKAQVKDFINKKTIEQQKDALEMANMASLQDIARLKAMEDQLKRHLENLEEMVLKRTGQLKDVNKQLEQEILERKKAEEALRESEEKYRTIFLQSPIGIELYDENGRLLEVNRTCQSIFGVRDTAELEGFKLLEDPNVPMDSISDLKRGLSTKYEVCFDFDIVKQKSFYTTSKTGNIDLDVLISPLTTDNGILRGYLVHVQDITSRKLLEKEMAHLDRLNLVGEMAAGIGHEVRNPMTTVRGFLQLLMNKEACNNQREYFNLMIEELDRANFIITEFLSLARNKTVQLELRSLKSIVQNLSPLIMADAFLSGKNIGLDLEEVPELYLDEKEIRQLILNLVRNGLEAMSSGGKMLIKYISAHKRLYWLCRMMAKESSLPLWEKIGTPFFTTKEQGTGLGLAVCYSIAARHNATVNIETAPTGTTFHIKFKLPGLFPATD